jgi:hypothetical protein
MPPRERINSREVTSPEGSDRAKDRSPSPGRTWTAERGGTNTGDETSDNARTLAFLRDAHQKSREIFKGADEVIDTFDKAASEGRFSALFQQKRDQTERWLID